MQIKRKALLIGVNKYRNPIYNLNGTVNDVWSMCNMLQYQYGMHKKDINIVTNEKATRINIINKMQKIIASDCETIIIYYSGHGTQISDDNGEEIDGLDEALCPHDYPNVIRDDEIAVMLHQAPRNKNIYIILDCCNSGVIEKGNNDLKERTMKSYLSRNQAQGFASSSIARPRFIDMDLETMAESVYRDDETKNRNLKPETKNISGSHEFIKKDVLKNVTILSAAREYQEAFELDMDGLTRGIMTFFLVNLLSSDKKNLSLSKLFRELCDKVRTRNTRQNPQISARIENLDKPIFS